MDKREIIVRQGRIKDDKELPLETDTEITWYGKYAEASLKSHKANDGPKVCFVFLIQPNWSAKTQVLQWQFICLGRNNCYQKHPENYNTLRKLQSFHAQAGLGKRFCGFIRDQCAAFICTKDNSSFNYSRIWILPASQQLSIKVE